MTCPASKRTTRPRARRTSVAAAGSPPKMSLHARARRSRALSPSRPPADVRRTCGLLAPVTPTPPAVVALLKLTGIIGPPPPQDEFLRQHPAPSRAGKD